MELTVVRVFLPTRQGCADEGPRLDLLLAGSDRFARNGRLAHPGERPGNNDAFFLKFVDFQRLRPWLAWSGRGRSALTEI